MKTHELATTGEVGSIRPSLRNGFNGLLRALPVIGLSCHCRQRDAERVFTDLMPASRHQDHTTSPSAPMPFASRHPSVHRIPAPASVAIARAPLFPEQDAQSHAGDLALNASRTFFAD